MQDDCYGGTYRYFTKIASPMGLNFTFADFSQDGELEKIINDKTKVSLATLGHDPH